MTATAKKLETALSHLRRGKLRKAERMLRPLARVAGPRRGEALLALAEVEARRGRPAEALACLDEAATIMAPRPALSLHRGINLATLGRHAEAVEAYCNALALDQRCWPAWQEMAISVRALGKKDDAAQCIAMVLQRVTDDPEGVQVFADRVLTLGYDDLAAPCYEALLRLSPADNALKVRLAVSCLRQSQVVAATQLLQEVLESDADNAVAWRQLGDAHSVGGKIAAAKEAYQRACEVDPSGDPLNWVKLGNIDIRQGDYEGAMLAFERAGDHPDALAGLSTVAERMGDKPRAKQLLDGRVSAASTTAILVRWAELVAKDPERSQRAANTVLKALQQARPRPERAALAHALGTIHDKQGEPDKAFTSHALANALRYLDFDTEQHTQAISDIITRTPRRVMNALPRSTVRAEPRPVLIVGMPRSGSSMAEQILASHPDVTGGGELEALRCTAIALGVRLGDVHTPYYKNLDELSVEELDRCAGEYLDALRAIGDTPVVTDKMPANFQHLPLLDRMLPEAKVIWIRRNPADAALSIFFQNFSAGLAYAASMYDIGVVYREQERLMKHYQQVVDLDILEMRYEDLVGDLETEVRELLAFCELDFDPRCLEFHKSDRRVITASHAQVNRPLYTSSVNRSDAYLAHMDDFFAGLEGRPRTGNAAA